LKCPQSERGGATNATPNSLANKALLLSNSNPTIHAAPFGQELTETRVLKLRRWFRLGHSFSRAISHLAWSTPR
jgi:hypothetical protein